jgi:hypothetical protein
MRSAFSISSANPHFPIAIGRGSGARGERAALSDCRLDGRPIDAGTVGGLRRDVTGALDQTGFVPDETISRRQRRASCLNWTTGAICLGGRLGRLARLLAVRRRGLSSPNRARLLALAAERSIPILLQWPAVSRSTCVPRWSRRPMSRRRLMPPMINPCSLGTARARQAMRR